MKRIPKPKKQQATNVSLDPETLQNTINVLQHGIAGGALAYGGYRLGKTVRRMGRQMGRMKNYMKGKD